jgi:hypothetical protein
VKPPNPLPGEKSLRYLLIGLLRVLGVIFLLLGLTAVVAGHRADKAVREQTLLPVSLKAGETVQEEFSTGNSLIKDLILRLHRSATVTNVAPFEAVSHRKPAGLDWKITAGSETVASGIGADLPLWSSRMGNLVNLGLKFLNLKPKTTYTFEATFNPQDSILPVGEVDVLIRTNFADAKRVGIRSAAFRFIGAIFCIGAVILAVLSFLPKRLL